MKEKKKEVSVALSIVTTIAIFLLITILIIMLYMVQQNSIAQVQNNNNNISSSSSSSTITTTNNTINTKNTPNSISLFLAKGYVNGKIAFFIATDASDNQTAAFDNQKSRI